MKERNALDELKEKIINAFRGVEYPGDDKIAIKKWYLNAESLDGYVGRRREDVSVDFINGGHRDCTSFMTQEAFYYYLPAFLILCLESAYEMDIFPEYIIRKLMPLLEVDYIRVLNYLREEEGIMPENANIFPSNQNELQREQFGFVSFIKMLSKEQREVIYDFLRSYENIYKDGMGQTALDRFWEDFKNRNFSFGSL